MESFKEKRLFIIANRTHYLNAKNYIESHSLGQNYVIVASNPYKGVEALYQEINEDKDLELIKIIVSKHNQNVIFEKIGVLFKILRIKSLKYKFNNFDKVFFTKYRSWVQHFIVKQFKAKQIVLLSDGIGVFPAVNVRKQSNKIHAEGSDFFIHKVLKLSPIDSLHFYSQVKIDVAERDSIEVFDFKVSRATAVNKKKIFFVGSNLVEEGYLHFDKNKYYLQQIKEKFSGSNITYFAHRREEDEQLKTYQFFGEVVRDTITFEERMSEQQELPVAVISYVSSVLINLPQIYPQVSFYYIPLKQQDIPEGSKFKKRYPTIVEDFERLNLPNFKKLTLEK